ncbi:hypothetical protein [Streptomyces rubradiris]|uniref:Uncharacterized protein n=1 Tax=Streptomyces rubradiris TaxID=285531 RepID=A0ABQ3RP09_STRRR|nr:hypothetical protein [Streptomyces rubradiris]GHH12409.1 hypothetical protein GCM10018792_37770 [Streptomyces rubradiris]GHI57596.1 hypothetical protein Srubr_74420 [Streptomyces rubradiris]
MSDTHRQPIPTDRALGPGKTPVPDEERHLATTVAAHPMLGSVGALARLLAHLPPELPLWLDEHVRWDPDERLKQQLLTVTPRIVWVDTADETEDASMEPGLELGTVCIPFDSTPDVQAAVAVRRDLLPADPYASAEERLEQGDVPGALGDLATLLQDIAALLSDVTDGLDRGSPDTESLRVEASTIGQAAARIARLAKTGPEGDRG